MVKVGGNYSDLNDDQRRFVDAYVDGAISAADAVIESGFAQFEGFTEHDVAKRLLASPRIQGAIRERAQMVNDQGIADQFWLLRRLVDYANADYTEVFGADGTPINPRDWPRALRLMVRKVKLCPLSGAVLEVTFEPKTKVLELIGRADLVGAFEAENQSNETIVLVRDMTKQVAKIDGGVIEAEAQRVK